MVCEDKRSKCTIFILKRASHRDCFLSYRALAFANTKAARDFITGLDPKYTPPEAKRTLKKLIFSLEEYILEHVQVTIRELQKRHGDDAAFIHTQADFWSTSTCLSVSEA